MDPKLPNLQYVNTDLFCLLYALSLLCSLLVQNFVHLFCIIILLEPHDLF